MEAAKAGWLDVANSESPEFIGKVISALARDPRLMEKSGRALVAAEIAQGFALLDMDGRQPVPLTLASV